MKKISVLLFASALTLLACNNEASDSVEKADSANKASLDSPMNTNTVTTDQESASFLVKALNGGMTEVQLGQLAQQKARDAKVKDFGSMMAHDHSAVNDQIKTLAASRNVTLPTTVGDEKQKQIDELSKKSAADFDKSYMNAMVDAHQNTIDMFKSSADKVNDTDIKTFINNTLPKVQVHLDSAKAIQKRLK